MSLPSTDALITGYFFSAATAAFTKKLMKPILTPCSFSNFSWKRLRISITGAMLTSLKVVRIALVACDCSRRSATRARRRLIGTRCSGRSPRLTATGGATAGSGFATAGAAGAALGGATAGFATASPGFFFHCNSVASATDSDSCGTLTSTIAISFFRCSIRAARTRAACAAQRPPRLLIPSLAEDEALDLAEGLVEQRLLLLLV